MRTGAGLAWGVGTGRFAVTILHMFKREICLLLYQPVAGAAFFLAPRLVVDAAGGVGGWGFWDLMSYDWMVSAALEAPFFKMTPPPRCFHAGVGRGTGAATQRLRVQRHAEDRATAG